MSFLWWDYQQRKLNLWKEFICSSCLYILCDASSLHGYFLEPFKKTFCLAGATMLIGTRKLFKLVDSTRFVPVHALFSMCADNIVTGKHNVKELDSSAHDSQSPETLFAGIPQLHVELWQSLCLYLLWYLNDTYCYLDPLHATCRCDDSCRRTWSTCSSTWIWIPNSVAVRLSLAACVLW